MNEPRTPTQLQLYKRDRELLERIKELIGGSSLSAAASFVFKHAGEQIVAWLEEGIQLKGLPMDHQSITNQMPTGSNQMPTGSNQSPTGSNQMPTGSNQMPTGSNQMPTGSNQSPTGSNQMPTGSNQMPTGSNQMPTGFSRSNDALSDLDALLA